MSAAAQPRAAALDDGLSLAAIATLAICTTALAHEAVGHGGTCLLLGGHVALLTNAFFRCTLASPWIDLGGPLGNVAAGLIALAALPLIPLRRPGVCLYALLVAAFCLYWEAGYLIFAMARGRGDTVFAWQGFFGAPSLIVRGAFIALGIAAYLVIGAALRRQARVFADAPGRLRRLLRGSWLTAVAAMAIAAAFYAPDRYGAVHDAALSAAASFPILFLDAPPPDEAAAPLPPSRMLAAIAAIAFLVFCATMGRGIS